MSKHTIRKRVLNQRDELSLNEIASFSEQIGARFLATTAFSAAMTLVLYSAIRSEVATVGIFAAALQAGKRVLYPRTVGETLEFVAVTDLDSLVAGRFGICEPLCGPVVPLAQIDLIVLPGVAFDQSGIRLGYGLGCYDRTLTEQSMPTLVGLAYDFQVISSLPRERHDVPVDFIVTERRVLTI